MMHGFSKLTIELKEYFWGKLTNATFVNLLCPTEQLMRYKVA